MIAFLSPAKNIRPAPASAFAPTKPAFLKEAWFLIEQLRQYSPWQLESILGTSGEIALRANRDHLAFEKNAQGWPAAMAFHGLAFWNLAAEDFSQADFQYANEHLRILSALYGSLLPADGIQPYRLDLQNKLRVNGKNLYHFWGDKVYRALFSKGQVVINLASLEYAKLITPYLQPKDKMITCDFMLLRRGRWVTQATEAKMARGQMAQFIVLSRISQPEELWQFAWNEYAYHPAFSGESRYVFTREG